MKRLSLLTACLLFAACGQGAGNFRNGFPRADDVKLDVPGKTSQALTGETGQKRDALKGDHSSFYDLTRGVTVMVNGGVGLVLGLVKAITNHPATTTTATSAVWGPYTEDLSPNTWKFTVNEVAPSQYEYKLEGKPKTAPDTDYVVVLSGTHAPALDANGNELEGFGAGTFRLDWDNAQALPEHDQNVGKLDVVYSRADGTSDTTVDVTFTQVWDQATGGLVDAAYKYAKHAAQGGWFEFSTNSNTDPNTSQIEHLAVKSRWNPDGAGRADVKATGGDIAPNEATANECWDSSFTSQYLTASWAPGVAAYNYGDESTDCVFTTADYSTL